MGLGIQTVAFLAATRGRWVTGKMEPMLEEAVRVRVEGERRGWGGKKEGGKKEEGPLEISSNTHGEAEKSEGR